ncbi:MAG TPA: outer membrane beta-barrel protein [Solimonas sp.]
MKSSKMALSVGGLLFAASCCIAPVHASEFYGGASLLYGQREKYNDLDPSWGGKGFVGYRFSPIPIFLEAEFLDTGKADADALPGASDQFSLQSNGYTLGVGYMLQAGETGSGVWLRGGYYDISTKLKVPFGSYPDDPTLSGSLKESSNGGTLGVGAIWKPNPYFGVRFEFETLFSPKDFANDENLNLFSIGLVFALPTQQAPKPYVPAATPPAIRPVAQPYQAPAYVPPPPVAPPAYGNAGTLATATHLLDRPRHDSGSSNAIVPAGTPVTVLRTLSNSEGGWNYVRAGNAEGWIADSALAR